MILLRRHDFNGLRIAVPCDWSTTGEGRRGRMSMFGGRRPDPGGLIKRDPVKLLQSREWRMPVCRASDGASMEGLVEGRFTSATPSTEAICCR